MNNIIIISVCACACNACVYVSDKCRRIVITMYVPCVKFFYIRAGYKSGHGSIQSQLTVLLRTVHATERMPMLGTSDSILMDYDYTLIVQTARKPLSRRMITLGSFTGAGNLVFQLISLGTTYRLLDS